MNFGEDQMVLLEQIQARLEIVDKRLDRMISSFTRIDSTLGSMMTTSVRFSEIGKNQVPEAIVAEPEKQRKRDLAARMNNEPIRCRSPRFLYVSPLRKSFEQVVSEPLVEASYGLGVPEAPITRRMKRTFIEPRYHKARKRKSPRKHHLTRSLSQSMKRTVVKDGKRLHIFVSGSGNQNQLQNSLGCKGFNDLSMMEKTLFDERAVLEWTSTDRAWETRRYYAENDGTIMEEAETGSKQKRFPKHGREWEHEPGEFDGRDMRSDYVKRDVRGQKRLEVEFYDDDSGDIVWRTSGQVLGHEGRGAKYDGERLLETESECRGLHRRVPGGVRNWTKVGKTRKYGHAYGESVDLVMSEDVRDLIGHSRLEHEPLYAKHDRWRYQRWSNNGRNSSKTAKRMECSGMFTEHEKGRCHIRESDRYRRRIDDKLKGKSLVDRDDVDNPPTRNLFDERKASIYGLTRSSSEELSRWINYFEDHLLKHNIHETEWLTLVYQSLAGPTGSWIKNIWELSKPRNWEEFKVMCQGEFVKSDQERNEPTPWSRNFAESRTSHIQGGPCFSESINQQVGGTTPTIPLHQTGIHQRNSVREYRDRFEAVCLNSASLPGYQLEELFLMGLKPNLQAAVNSLQPKGIVQIMDLAQWIEEVSSQQIAEGNNQVMREFRCTKLIKTREELDCQELIDRQKEYQLHVWVPVEEKAFRVHGFVGNREISIEIDSGATDSHLSRSLATEIGLTYNDIEPIKVTLGHGNTVDCFEKTEAVSIFIQNILITEEFLLLKLSDIDVILGYDWLSKLGETRVNWQENTFSFYQNEGWVTVRGKEADLKETNKKEEMLLSHNKTLLEVNGISSELKDHVGKYIKQGDSAKEIRVASSTKEEHPYIYLRVSREAVQENPFTHPYILVGKFQNFSSEKKRSITYSLKMEEELDKENNLCGKSETLEIVVTGLVACVGYQALLPEQAYELLNVLPRELRLNYEDRDQTVVTKMVVTIEGEYNSTTFEGLLSFWVIRDSASLTDKDEEDNKLVFWWEIVGNEDKWTEFTRGTVDLHLEDTLARLFFASKDQQLVLEQVKGIKQVLDSITRLARELQWGDKGMMLCIDKKLRNEEAKPKTSSSISSFLFLPP